MARDELDEQFEELERRSDLYARTWWLQPDGPASRFLHDHPELRPILNKRLRANLPTGTVDVFAGDSKRDWHPSRARLQREIIADLDAKDDRLAEAGDGNGDGHSGPGDSVYFVLGLPGSGKTKVLRRLAALHASGAVAPIHAITASDADEVRVEFPEYAGGLGSGVVQDETAVVTYGALHLTDEGRQDRVLARGGVAVVDVIGDPTHLPKTVRLLAASGRSCYVLVTDCPVEVCQERAKLRAVQSGRLVPLWLIEEKDGVPQAALDAALATKLVAGWAVIDTSGPEPQLLTGDGVFDKYLEGLAEELK